jgi:peptide/nickel transport system substrate-binding protein
MIRGTLDNVLSGIKACFEFILNSQHPIERQKMFNQKSSSKLSATLLALILGASVFMAGQVWAAKYVTDPATGETWTTPEYGGTITQAVVVFPPSCSNWWNLGWAPHFISGVVERLAFADWAKSREIWDGRVYVVQTPKMSRGNLAESWSMPDDTTWIWNIRKGVHWHDKAPMNGRLFDAKDVEWNYHRYFGMGEFKEDGPNAGMGGITYGMDIASVKATDQWTIEIKLNKPDIDMPGKMLNNYFFVHAPEQIEKYGDAKDCTTLVGTGPFELAEVVEGSSATWKKNPKYWATDEKFGNRLPYIDELKSLLIPDMAARLAGLRTGKIDIMGNTGDAYINSVDDMQSLQRSRPDIDIWPAYITQGGVFFYNWTLPPTDDVRVRKALQMAVDREAIAKGFFKGFGDPAPYGIAKQDGGEYSWPYENWPDKVKREYEYHPEEAEALLDAAGYKRGADGYRFKLKLAHFDRWDATYSEVIMGYLEAIGVESELRVMPVSEFGAIRKQEHDYALVNGYYGWWGSPGFLGYTLSTVSSADGSSSSINLKDPRLDKLFLAAQKTTDLEELKSIFRQFDEICIRDHCALNKSVSPLFFVSQPWVQGYFGEAGMGWGDRNTVQARLWIDQELKAARGH